MGFADSNLGYPDIDIGDKDLYSEEGGDLDEWDLCDYSLEFDLDSDSGFGLESSILASCCEVDAFD